MVDHNILASSLAYLYPFVNEIVDHHEDQIKDFQGVKDVRKIGSTCSTIAHYYMKEEGAIDKVIA